VKLKLNNKLQVGLIKFCAVTRYAATFHVNNGAISCRFIYQLMASEIQRLEQSAVARGALKLF